MRIITLWLKHIINPKRHERPQWHTATGTRPYYGVYNVYRSPRKILKDKQSCAEQLETGNEIVVRELKCTVCGYKDWQRTKKCKGCGVAFKCE